MEVPETMRDVRSMAALEKLFDQIERGGTRKPDWIELKGDADLARLSEPALRELLGRMHASVLRGFRPSRISIKDKQAWLAHWRTLAQCGFHDFAEGKWSKGFDSPFVENYDYVGAYLEGGLAALDPYLVYSSVLGTWEYGVEDFTHTEIGRGVKTIVEPLAGTAELCYAGHFQRPDLSYCMFDLDPSAKAYVDAKPWLEGTRREFLLGDALEESTWQAVREFSVGTSMGYIGKQSHNFFNAKELLLLLDWGTRYTDYLMLEVSEPYLLDEEPAIDELTRKEQKRAGFRVALDDVEDRISNPLTNAMSFHLIAWDKDDKARASRRELFGYCDWTGWQAPTLTAFGRLLDLEVRYYHNELTEFVSVDEHTETSDCRDNNTFLMFSRK
jgi:hypothetical protein